MSALTNKDLQTIEAAQPRRPLRWTDYVHERDWKQQDDGTLWQSLFDPVMPFSIIDPRIMDLARTFWDNPNDCLLTAYRRLEDIFRKRTGSDEHGAKLFSVAFRRNPAMLRWDGCDSGEHDGRAQLFAAAFMAYRNPRAHRELAHNANEALTEFLLLNQLFLLEKDAVR